MVNKDVYIYRQQCALHISSYTVHHPTGGVHSGSVCLVRRDTIVFRGVNIPPYGVAT